MDWVADGIAIGGLRDVLDYQRLHHEGVEALLQLYGHPRERCEVPLPLDLLQLEVRDREPLPPRLLTQGVKFIRRQRLAGRSILVACGAGMSRSPTYVAAYLHEEGMEFSTAFRQLRTARPIIRPHRALLTSVLRHYGLDPSPEALRAALGETVRGERRALDWQLDEE